MQWLRTLAAATLPLMACAAWSAPAGNYPVDVEWVEAAVPDAPTFSTHQGIAIDMPRHISIKVALDPATLAIGSDSVVRYVAYMTNVSGSVSAVYEGIRCATDEVKTYARWGSTSDQWTRTTEPTWRHINDNLPSKHAYAIARQGVCETRLPQRSVADTVRALLRPTRNTETRTY